MGWGVGIPALDFTGFSGHSAMSATVLPVLLYLCAPASRPRLAWLGAGCGIGLALVIGWSRLAVGAHSSSEVLSGLTLGFASSLAFLNWPGRALPRSVAPLVATVTGFIILQTWPLPRGISNTHGMVERMALQLSGREYPRRRSEFGLRPCVAGVYETDDRTFAIAKRPC
ncbi:phosphatase PAP2 family protein [Cupriavidus consociatus]|uniref:phosphatase PAP2 family protein n=1 Tax=Cupriavidus consociatus TaxID=2821357 RepID=UPI003D727CDE